MIGSTHILLFVVLSVVAVTASLHAWRTRLAYGFFRFFSFEFLAVLVAWNASRWFRNPLSIRQVVSWIIFAASTALAIHGVHLLRSVGKARRRVMESTETVIEVGAYRFIRHPLYASLLFIGWGVFLKGPDVPSALLVLASTACWIATARCEERFNIDRFGVAYSDYMKRTKMFIPFVL
jgi:protein-S-isoprenylcysteine O-methyltransferase Ste14